MKIQSMPNKLLRSTVSACLVFFTLMAHAQVPANDEPCNAITLTATSSCTYQTFTNENATGSLNVPAPGCANYAGGDVWFQVTVPPGGALLFDTQEGVMLDGGMAIYSGTCGNLTLIDCDDDDSQNGLMSFIAAGGLTPGSTIWIRMWEYGGDDNGTFGICVTIPPPAPANDDPCNAILIPVNSTCVYQSFTNASALGTVGLADPGCAFYSGGDVWFKAVVPQGGAVLFDSQEGTMLDGGMAIYSGSCGNLNLLECNDNGSGNGDMPLVSASNLTPGDTLWIRMWSYGNTSNGTFGICATIPPPGPANDDPCNAIQLTAGYTCNYTTYSNAFALNTTGIPAPACAFYQGGDVWFKVTVPCGGSILVDCDTAHIQDAGMALYTGNSCDSLTEIACDDDGSSNGLMPQIIRSNLTPGSTVWIRFWEFGGDDNGTFKICVSTPPPPLPGNSCASASSFCTGTLYNFPNNTNIPQLGGGGVYGCLTTTPNPVFYYMQIQNPGNISITINQVSNTGSPIDVDFALWGPFLSLSSACTGISANNIVDCSYSTAATEIADIANAQAGQFYMLLITNYANQPGSISFQQTGGNATTNCAVICSNSASNSGPVCPNSTINLFSTAVTGANYTWTGPDCFTSTSQNPVNVLPPSQPGVYAYSVTASTDSGSNCYATTIVTVLEGPALGPDTSLISCSSTSVNLYEIYDTTGYQASWSLNGNPVSNPTSVNTGGNYQLIASQGSAGCKDTAYFNLSVSIVNATGSVTNANCTDQGQILLTNATGAAPINYGIDSNPGVFQQSPSFSVSPGNYVITVKDSNNCTASIPLSVGFTDNLILEVRVDTSICAGESVVLSTSGNASAYSWSPASGLNDPSAASPVSTPATTTDYTVTATLGSCTRTEEVKVSIIQSVSVDAGPTQVMNAGGSVTLQASASGATGYSWSPATGLSSATALNPTANPAATTVYTITASNNSGCVASDTVSVIVIPNCVAVRNAFSPNGDGNNDLWKVYDDYGCLENVSVQIFNRYGNKVFESRDYRNNWDGKYNGKPVPDGTYYGVIQFTLITGRTYMQKTDITIIR